MGTGVKWLRGLSVSVRLRAMVGLGDTNPPPRLPQAGAKGATIDCQLRLYKGGRKAGEVWVG